MWPTLDRVLRSSLLTFAPPANVASGLPEVTLVPPSAATDAEELPTATASVPMKRVWAMPNKWTFKIKPIKELLDRYEVGHGWIDPFAGFNSPAEYTNDINPESPASYHLPAHDFLTIMLGEGVGVFAGAVFDPPYSIHQVKVAYDSYGLYLKDNITGGFPKEKDLISQLVMPGGIVISFGWNTVGMGKKRGFEAVEYMAVSHGGNRNDTLVTVERKI